MPKVEIFTHDDWIDVFIDGDHAHGGHSIDAEELLDLLNIPYTARRVSEEEVEALQETYPSIGER
jgi:hypothetical protein